MKLSRGFSLLELLIVLTIIVIVSAFLIPSQTAFLKKSNADIISSQLLRAIGLARNESITRGMTVMLCKSNDQKTCRGEWRDGFIVYANETVFFSFQNPTIQGTLYWRAASHRTQLEFLPTGFTNMTNGTFWYCEPTEKNPAWAIVVNKAGRARLIYPNANQKIDFGGDVLRC